jgi:hypothetical protein
MNTKKGKIILPATDPSSIDVNKLKPGQVVLFGDSTKEGSISMKRKDGRINDLAELGSNNGSSSGSVSYPDFSLLADAVRQIENNLTRDVVPPSVGFIKNIGPFIAINKQLEVNSSMYDRWNGYDINVYANEVISAGLQSSWTNELESLLKVLDLCKAILQETVTTMKMLSDDFSHAQEVTGSDLSAPINELQLSKNAGEDLLQKKEVIIKIVNELRAILQASQA